MEPAPQDTEAVTIPAFLLSRRDLKALARALAILARVQNAASDASWRAPNEPGQGAPRPFGLGRIAADANRAADALSDLAISCDVYGEDRGATESLPLLADDYRQKVAR